MKRPLIAGNWKMNNTRAEAVNMVTDFLGKYRDVGADIALCPPFTALYDVKKALEGSGIKLGAQNVHHEAAGAFTGEVSVPMLKDLGVDMVIVGHSERRHIFGEKDELINKKVINVLRGDLTPVLCVGETLKEREEGNTKQTVKGQVIGGITGLSKEEICDVVIAYEPVWAIGTGKSATAEDANNVIGYIREVLAGRLGKKKADIIRILYGGSVNAANAASLLRQPQINGALVGGASLKAGEFWEIIKHSAGEEII